jgi:SAM-dependent methyltransferase
MNLTTALKIIKITKNSYSQIADSFAESRFYSWAEIDEAIKKYVKPGDKILDLGCGNGRLLKSLKNISNIEYLGLDNCNNLIEKFQGERNEKTKFLCQDILNLTNISNDSFNVIFAIASFNHLPSNELRQKTISELHRLLKPNGILIMTNWNLWQIGAKKSVWRSFMSSPRRRGSSSINPGFRIKSGMTIKDVFTFWQNKFPLYYYAFTLRELKKLFSSASFQILENSFVHRGKKARWWNGHNILTVGKK